MTNEKLKILNESLTDFKRNQLPSIGDVIKAIYLKNQKESVSVKSASDHAAWCIGAMWQRSEIPVISARGIESRIHRIVEDYRNVLKYDESRKNYTDLVNEFIVSFRI